MKYTCSECHIAVIVVPGHEPVKYCKCEAPIVADMSSNITVEADMKN